MKNKLKDPWWRLNNLYYIKDKAGKKVLFKPNWAQKLLYNNMWFLSLMLKARQLGITTFIQLFMLDRCLFNANTNAGVVAHNKEDAEAFFDDKIKFAYDHLPEDLKKEISCENDTARSLKFSNKSRIRVGTSLRSGTYQYIHVSEYGKMCAKFPDKAEEVKTGTLNTVDQGQFVFIESTAEGPQGDFYDRCMAARDITIAAENGQTELTPMDYKFFFLPWWQHPDYVLDTPVFIPEEDEKYFAELKKEHGIELTDPQKWWYVKKHIDQGQQMKQEYPSTPEEAFERSTDIAIFGKQMIKARREKRIGDIPIVRGVPVNTFWDLGRNDNTAIWFHQHVGAYHNFVYYLEGRLQDLTVYAMQLQELREEFGWLYGTHYLPHDVNVTDLSSVGGYSRRQILEAAGVRPIVAVAKARNLIDDIEVSRRKIDECRFDETRCIVGLKRLRGYEWSYDNVNKINRKTVAPNAARHGADAFRQFAVGYKGTAGTFSSQAKKYGGSGRRSSSTRGSVYNPDTKHVV